MQTIVVVEDEKDILDLVEYTLEKEGFDVVGFVDTSKVKEFLDEERVALMLMDRNLPNCEGSSFVKELRGEGYDTPVIFLSAKDSSEDILKGFERGGDDYITKPFNPKELVARVKAVLKRVDNKRDILKIRDILFDNLNSRVFIEGEEVQLSRLEKRLLYLFMINKDRLLDRNTLLEEVWEDSLQKQPKTVNVAIKRLKEKIDPKGEKEYIKSVRGEGYIFC
ncbi:MAG: response regulator transcription factor [Epsilonproteobacteria bacterium]|nr:response regulator transcription factor [Campylobacterota bacterium]